jgi:hypothetical protein
LSSGLILGSVLLWAAGDSLSGRRYAWMFAVGGTLDVLDRDVRESARQGARGASGRAALGTKVT